MRNVGYVTSPELVELSSNLPAVAFRSKLVTDLIKSYTLLKHVDIIEPIQVSCLQLTEFHTKHYIETLSAYESTGYISDSLLAAHGLEYDCRPFPKIYSTVCHISGATLAAAENLVDQINQVVINWFGGWHHGKPDRAEGYCYVNDCVLAIRYLLQYFSRVLYIDLDLHHGDGVQDAFYHTPKVLTYSLHKHGPGFYPGTGSTEDRGSGRGTGYCVNIPLKDGASDSTLHKIIDGTLDKVVEKYRPDVIVCQCGVDGVFGDPHQAFTYTAKGLSRVIQQIVEYDKPTLLLGGGGYDNRTAARTWCTITADVLGVEVSNDIPEHEYFCEYAPGYELEIPKSRKYDENVTEYLNNVIGKTLNCIDLIK